MAKLLTVLVIIVKVLLSNGQEDHFIDEPTGFQHPHEENPNYSYGYGVADSHTGDIKTVWEAKKGDTVKGHYSVIEPDGSMRSVEYSAGPNTGFTATVNRDGLQVRPTDEEDVMEEKALRDYERNYDFSEDAELHSYKSIDRKRHKHPYESYESFKDYSLSKRPNHPMDMDMEPSEYTHSFSIKHQRDDLNAEPSGHSHVGVSFDPNCNTKNKKQKNKHYTSGADLDFRKQKYPPLTSDSYNNDYDKYIGDSSNIEIEKLIHMYKQNERYKPYKPDDTWSSTKNSFSGMSDIPHSEDSYSDYLPLRPKKKSKPHKNQEFYESDDLDDYVLVPKKKLKKPPRDIEPYRSESDEEFDETYEDERYHKPPRGTRTEVIRKVVKKKKPVINILDIFDI